jgi:O-antigen/teichoic acid export membrane protein
MEADDKIITSVPGASRADLVRGFTLDFRVLWAIADQGVVSLGNFLTTIILARAVTPAAYGIWSVIFGLILFLNVLPASLVNYPMSVRLASHDDSEASRLLSAGLALTALLTLPQVLILFTASFLIANSTLALTASIALMLWQLQETMRRALMAQLAFRTAVYTDAISYLGQAALCWLLARNGNLSPQAGFGVIGITCGLAGIVQLWLIRIPLNLRIDIRHYANTFWATSRWILGSNLIATFSLQAVPWTLFFLRGPAEAAGYQAITNLVGVSHPIMLSLGSFLVPAVARTRVKQGMPAARRIAFGQAVQAGLLLLPYLLALLLFPRPLLGLFYGTGSAYLQLGGPLRLLAITYVLTYCGLAMKFFLNALETRNRAQFLIELCGAIFLGAMLIPLTQRFGVMGAIVATALSLVARLASNATLVRQVNA